MGRFSRTWDNAKTRRSVFKGEDLEKGLDVTSPGPENVEGADEDEEEVPQMNVTSTVILLVIVAVVSSASSSQLGFLVLTPCSLSQ